MNGHGQNQPSFQEGWWSFDLGKYRGCDGTYCYYESNTLPPLDKAADWLESLAWLPKLDAARDNQMQLYRNEHNKRGNLEAIKADVERLNMDFNGEVGVRLPPPFVTLMGDPDLQNQIPSCTACTFGLSPSVMKYPGAQGGSIVRFLTDQQDVLIWYLHLAADGTDRVLVTPIPMEEMVGKANNGTLTEDERQAIQRNTWKCGDSFASFIYRWWLENTLWFKVSESNDESKLTEDERKYCQYYEDHSVGQ